VSLHPFRHNKPRDVGGERVKFDSRDLALTAVFAALYVIINVVQMVSVGNPTVYGPIQLRVADCLIALAAMLGWPIVAGVTVGCFLTNAYYFLGAQDVIFGPIANLIAATAVFLLRRRPFMACVTGALPIGFIVGGYLSIIFDFSPPEALSVLPAWSAMMVSITISSLIAIAGIGYLVLTILRRKSVMEPLKSHGLKVLTQDNA
jgi:uncharacterized membrane protein